jgi:hypothetical protein
VPDRKATDAERILITVAYIRQGSLDIGLNIEPVELLGKLFEHNFNYFEIFLRTYIPIAFLESIPYPSSWSDIVDQLEMDVVPSLSFRQRFQMTSNELGTPIKHRGITIDKAKWLWIASNTSLVIPVLLTIGIFYTAYKDNERREDMIEQRTFKIIEQKDLIIDELFKFSFNAYPKRSIRDSTQRK